MLLLLTGLVRGAVDPYIIQASTLDSSASALASATTTVTIGSAEGAHDGHDHDHGGSDGSDDVHGYWSAVPQTPSTYTVNVGEKLSFQYTDYHNIWVMTTNMDYVLCQFGDGQATEVASAVLGGGSGNYSNLYETAVTAPGNIYFACQVSNHCTQGQKIKVTVVASPSPPALPPSPPPGAEDEESAAPRLVPAGLSMLLAAVASVKVLLR